MKIHISEFPVFMKLGYFSRERLTGQEILVSLEVTLEDTPFPGKEELSHSVDYGNLIRLVEETIKDKEVKLVETVVNMLGLSIMEHFALISEAFIKIEKPILPDGLGKGARVSVSHMFSRN